MPAINWKGTFDSAHFIPGHPKCGRLHGHTYNVEVTLEGSNRQEHPIYLVDFAEIKAIINILDHKLIVPIAHKEIKLTEVRESDIAKAHTEEKPIAPDFWLIDWPDGQLKLRANAVAIVQATESSSEVLSELFAMRLGELFQANVDYIDVKVSETPNTWARSVMRKAPEQPGSGIIAPGGGLPNPKGRPR